MKESGDDVTLADCGLLLQKYLDDSNRQMDALFILADLFNRYDNNTGNNTVKLLKIIKMGSFLFKYRSFVKNRLLILI